MVMGDDIGMETEDIIETLRKKFERVSVVLDERGRRVRAAAEADALGYGGQSLVASATGLARTTIHREGIRQAMDQQPLRDRIRRVGRWPQKTDGGPTRIAVGPGGARGPDAPGRSRKPVALDVLEYPSTGGHLNCTGLSNWPSNGGSPVG